MNTTPTNRAGGSHSDESVPLPIGPPGESSGKEIESWIQSVSEYTGPERRLSRRIPKSLEISIQPLSESMEQSGKSFFAITRDVGQGGLAYLSSEQADFEKAVISLNDGIGPGIVCRVCGSTVIHSSPKGEVCLTNVEFLYVYRRRKS